MAETVSEIDPGARAAAPERLRRSLEQAEAELAAVRPLLRRLVTADDASLISEEVVARVAAMLQHLAVQLAGPMGPTRELARALAGSPPLLSHAQALALEFALGERIKAGLGVDPVLPPLLARLVASERPDAELGRRTLAAQARFVEAQRRMELRLDELPGDLLRVALQTRRTLLGNVPATQADAADGALRLTLLRRAVAALGPDAIAALDLLQAGPALFLSALAIASGRDRDDAALATAAGQRPRLAVMLAAAGLATDAVERQLALLDPDAELPGLDALDADDAVTLLASVAS